MKLALFNNYRLGLIDGARIRDVSDAVPDHDTEWPWPFVPRLLARLPELRLRLESAAQNVEPRDLNSVRWLPPVPLPGQIVAAVANYHEHEREMAVRVTPGAGDALQGEVFLKSPGSLIGHGGTVVLPNVPGREIHHEAELAAIVGRRMYQVSIAEALDYVCGYTCLMDLTVRGVGDRSRRKSYAGFTPLGPWLVTADEIADPQDLHIRLWCNGTLRQDDSTHNMVYTTAELLAYASAVMPLMPGDILATGTPAGVGPISAGDQVEMEIDAIGRLAINVAAAPSGWPIAEVGLDTPKAHI